MRRAIVLLTPLLLLVSASAADDPLIPEPSQNPSATYRLFRTMNIFTLLKLDTRTGQVWQVQWSNSDEAHKGYFSLEPYAIVADWKGQLRDSQTREVYPRPNSKHFQFPAAGSGRWQNMAGTVGR